MSLPFSTKQIKLPLIFSLISIVLYAVFSYDLVRTEHLKLIALYAALFLFYYKLVSHNYKNLKFLIVISVLFRLVFLFAIPNLSQDFYRFIWDGNMLFSGYNPYLTTPLSYDVNSHFPFYRADELIAGMGQLNASHFTNYPPINQCIFYIASWFSNLSILASVTVLRIFIIAADIGTIYFGRKLLNHLKLDPKNIFWFALNPLVILELTGNLHFEGVMIFFLIWSMYLLYKQKWFWSAVLLAMSISTKLIPLMFLPLLYKWYMGKQAQSTVKGFWPLCRYYLVVGVATLLIFLPFYSSEFINNYSQTVGLWFQNFEFNASIYYLLRALGFAYYGYNNIAVFGPWLAVSVIVFIVVLGIFGAYKYKASLLFMMLFALGFYLLTTTTVHPWYLTTLLALSVFTPYKSPMVWSATIIFSYLAYTDNGFNEKPLVLMLEYIPVFAFLIWELFWKKSKISSIPIET